MEVLQSWICPNCGRGLDTEYCGACGERRLGPRDLTFHHFIEQFVESFTDIDGRLLRSLRLLLLKPGELTANYSGGRRKPFLGPLALFLVANATFFAVQSISKYNIFASSLASHLHEQDWSGAAQRLVDAHLVASHTTMAAFAPNFDEAAILNSKALIILMVFAFAWLPPLVFAGRGKPFATHLTFSLHLYAFLLLLFCVSLGVAALDARLGGGGLTSHRVDAALSVFNLLVCAAYLYRASWVVYGGGLTELVLKAGILTLAAGALVPGYRFAVFLITLHTA